MPRRPSGTRNVLRSVPTGADAGADRGAAGRGSGPEGAQRRNTCSVAAPAGRAAAQEGRRLSVVASGGEAVTGSEGRGLGDQPRVLIADCDAAFCEQVGRLAQALGLVARACSNAQAMLSELDLSLDPTTVIVNVSRLEAEGARMIPPLARRAADRVVLVCDPGTEPIRIAAQLGAARHLNIAAILEKPVTDSELQGLLLRPLPRPAV